MSHAPSRLDLPPLPHWPPPYQLLRVDDEVKLDEWLHYERGPGMDGEQQGRAAVLLTLCDSLTKHLASLDCAEHQRQGCGGVRPAARARAWACGAGAWAQRAHVH